MGYRVGFLGLLVASMASAAPVQWSVNGHFYERIAPPSGISWTSARTAAQALTHMGLPGHLATLTSAAEAQFVYTNTNVASGYTWIGFTDEVIEGQYRWVTGEPTGYTDWLANEPNNQASNPPGEDYANIDFREPDGGWNDYQNLPGILGGPPIAYLVEYEAKKPAKKSDPREALRAAALQLPGVEEGIACAGTSLEKRTMKVRGKAFLFLGPKDAMMKLAESADDAAEFAACKVGAHGWVTVKFDEGERVPLDVLERWVEESYCLFAPTQAAPAPVKKVKARK